jgi:hypothetical protein
MNMKLTYKVYKIKKESSDFVSDCRDNALDMIDFRFLYSNPTSLLLCGQSVETVVAAVSNICVCVCVGVFGVQ